MPSGATLLLPRGPGRVSEGGLRTRGWFKITGPDAPLVSVVTVVLNSRSLLEQTIRSVLAQTHDNIEYVVIDGGSSDGTVDIIREHDHAIDYWVSEPDQGISEAFNKGIGTATGEMVGILNAGDWYTPSAVSQALKVRDRTDRFAIYHGCVAYCHEDGTFAFQASPDLMRIWRYMSVFHPTMLVEREVYQRVGLYSSAFRYAMDCELVHRALRAGVRFVLVPEVQTHMRLGGRSHRHFQRAFAEFRDSVILHGGARLPAYWRYATSTLKRAALRYRAGRRLKALRDRLRGKSTPLLIP